MERKTKVDAENSKHDLHITREFDLPVDLLFRAHVDPEILEQWMGSKVLKLETKKHGGYQLEKKDENGKVVFRANGVIHELVPDKKITRTFEMENTPFGVQLEVYEFEPLSNDTSRLRMHVIYETIEQRDQLLKMPFAAGLNMAHNRIQEILSKLK
ncbi:MAG: ATPase [Bacteroidetes bacterium]|nr:MAG: ATPase [Bacteroidota bacterium]